MCDARLVTPEEGFRPLGFPSRAALYEAIERGHIRTGIYRVNRAIRLDLNEVRAGLRAEAREGR